MQIDRPYAKVLDEVLFKLYGGQKHDTDLRTLVETGGDGYDFDGTMELLRDDDLITIQGLDAGRTLISITRKGKVFHQFKGFVHLVDEEERSEQIHQMTVQSKALAESSNRLSKNAIIISVFTLIISALIGAGQLLYAYRQDRFNYSQGQATISTHKDSNLHQPQVECCHKYLADTTATKLLDTLAKKTLPDTTNPKQGQTTKP